MLVELFPVRRQGGTGTLDRVSTEGRRKSRIPLRGHRQRPGEFGTEQFERFSNGRRHGHPGRLRSEYNSYCTYLLTTFIRTKYLLRIILRSNNGCFAGVSYFSEIVRSQLFTYMIATVYDIWSPRLPVFGRILIVEA